jgi:hypothetical protein
MTAAPSTKISIAHLVPHIAPTHRHFVGDVHHCWEFAV